MRRLRLVDASACRGRRRRRNRRVSSSFPFLNSADACRLELEEQKKREVLAQKAEEDRKRRQGTSICFMTALTMWGSGAR